MRRITLTLYSIGLIIMSFGFFHEGRGELAADDILRKLDQWQAEQIRLWKNGKQPAEEYLLEYRNTVDQQDFVNQYLVPFRQIAGQLLRETNWVDYPASLSCLYNVAPVYEAGQSASPEENTSDAIWLAWLLTETFHDLTGNSAALSKSPSGKLILAWAYGSKDEIPFKQAWQEEIQRRPVKVLSFIAIQKNFTKEFLPEVCRFLDTHPEIIRELPRQVKLKLALKQTESLLMERSGSRHVRPEDFRNDRLLQLLSRELAGCEISVDIQTVKLGDQSSIAIQSGWSFRSGDESPGRFIIKVNGEEIPFECS
ncbi:hypothetical protein [uncultured Victivallis sp.]|uniref:hypothetical protein n=1 Tax=uncultured Victivallis sp. TaxID=354118 RepID=UPI0025E218E4|nr:hypothetical protein [uncultured Victivallis sp.]